VAHATLARIVMSGCGCSVMDVRNVTLVRGAGQAARGDGLTSTALHAAGGYIRGSASLASISSGPRLFAMPTAIRT
jgi:hypothetical protein